MTATQGGLDISHQSQAAPAATHNLLSSPPSLTSLIGVEFFLNLQSCPQAGVLCNSLTEEERARTLLTYSLTWKEQNKVWGDQVNHHWMNSREWHKGCGSCCLKFMPMSIPIAKEAVNNQLDRMTQPLSWASQGLFLSGGMVH
jgi:hypothetical protein